MSAGKLRLVHPELIANASAGHLESVQKVIIQIPCYNEAETLELTLAELPRSLIGARSVEWLVVDDGSTDGTAELASSLGVHHVIRHQSNLGLARAFETGLEASVRAGADIIVNTDADNQYRGEDIQLLVSAVLGGADMVIGERPIRDIDHFSWAKKRLQVLGSSFIRLASGTQVIDAPSGFRAFSRSTALKLNVFSDYTYTLETIIQAGQKNMSVVSVPIRVNADQRPSRLVKSIPSYIRRSLITALRAFVTYRPLRSLGALGAIVFAAGSLLGMRFLFDYFSGQGEGHVQSLILTAVLLIIGFQLFLFGLVADLMSVNRKLLEKIDWRTKNIEFDRRRRPR